MSDSSVAYELPVACPKVETMNKNHTIAIKNTFDVILARMQVRQQARATGLGIQDQACIALATSSLARALKLGETVTESRIDIYCSDEGERSGVQVVCTIVDGVNYDTGSKAFADTKWMVDDITVETLSSNDVEITLVKWAT